MIMIWPYLKLLRSSSDVYFLLYWRPTILIRLLISAFSRICNHTHKKNQISKFHFSSELEGGLTFAGQCAACNIGLRVCNILPNFTIPKSVLLYISFSHCLLEIPYVFKIPACAMHP